MGRLGRCPEVPSDEMRQHVLVHPGVLGHAVDIGPERLGVVRRELELNVCIEAHQFGGDHHAGCPVPVGNPDTVIEAEAGPFNVVQQVAHLAMCTWKLPHLEELEVALLVALVNRDDDLLDVLEREMQARNVVDVLGEPHGDQQLPPRRVDLHQRQVGLEARLSLLPDIDLLARQPEHGVKGIPMLGTKLAPRHPYHRMTRHPVEAFESAIGDQPAPFCSEGRCPSQSGWHFGWPSSAATLANPIEPFEIGFRQDGFKRLIHRVILTPLTEQRHSFLEQHN